MNSCQFHDFGGKPISKNQLDGVGLKLYLACKENSSCEFVAARQDEELGFQSVIVDFKDGSFDISNPIGIRRVERLAISYRNELSFPLEVRALRKDFPTTSFRQHSREGEPKILCLYLAPWKSVERTWTAPLFIKRILWWLRSTADGTIHNDDQPAEQVFFASGYTVVLPKNYFDDEAPKKLAFNQVVNEKDGTITLIGQHVSDDKKINSCCLSLSLVLEPVESGPMEEIVDDLGSLHDMLQTKNCDLFTPLKGIIEAQITSSGITPSKDEFILLILGIPRVENGQNRGFEVQGFSVNLGLCDLGEKMSVLVRNPEDKRYYRETSLLRDPSSDWRAIELYPVNIRSYPNERTVRQYSGLDPEDKGPVGIIAGVGALGGLLAKIWCTECWGNWHFVDSDIIQAHNIARHIASHRVVGYPKAKVVNTIVHDVHPGDLNSLSQAFVEDIETDNKAMNELVAKASLLVDATTTTHVPRIVARRDEFPRTASVFLTPSGSSAVMLMEDAERSIRCNHLEAQYYRAVLTTEWGESHLKNHLGKYSIGGGCREVTVALSNEILHLHSGNLARQLRIKAASSEAKICIWEYQGETGSTICHDIPVHKPYSVKVGDWEIVYDEGFLIEAENLRAAALPSETGGVLLGIVDQVDLTITLVRGVPSPSGSEENAFDYTRAGYNSDEFMKDCWNRTAEIVTYVGEWHSHPVKVPPLPSESDFNQHAFVNASLSQEGQVAVMMIISDDSIGFYINDTGTILKLPTS